jgi:dihydroorotate dehydrogenase electron transfer subunit
MAEQLSSTGGIPIMTRVTERVQENPRTVSLILESDLAALPGQFAMVWLPDIDEKPYSISGIRPLMITVSKVGPFSEALAALGPGDKVGVRGPFGAGWSVTPGRVLLVGGGYGAAPLHFLACSLLSAGAHVETALGARASADLLFADRFRSLGLPLHVATEDGSAGFRGRVTDAVGPLLGNATGPLLGGFDRLCACGPEPMLERLEELCRAARLPAELSHEAYMRCGIGICGACEHAGRLVCMDGPVFAVPPAGR